MGKTMQALLRLQSIEHRLAEVRKRLRSQSVAVEAQQGRIDELRAEHKRLHDEALGRQRGAGEVELDLRTREEMISKLRQSLNTAKTNKEYAAILTQINTLKADNSKLEDEALKFMQAGDQIRTEADEVARRIAEAEAKIEQIKQNSAEQVARLEQMRRELEQDREGAAGDVPSGALSVFERLAETRDGDVMAQIEIHGRKPPHEYVCGGCFMSIRAEHANALRTKDEIRFCDSCGRILYLQEQTSPQQT